MAHVSDLPGSGDCEMHSQDWGQPVLAATSWAYVIAGIALVVWFSRRQDIARGWAWAFAIGLILTGLGSADYHGPAWTPQPFFHDGGLALALLVALGIDITRITGATRVGVGVAAAAGVVSAGALLLSPEISPVLAGVIALALVASEAVIYRRHLRSVNWTQYTALACLAIGGVVFALSRTGAPLCSPESLLQGHGLWHILTAVALMLWAVGALPGTSAGIPPTAAPRTQERTA
jgi:hypothetical protein